MKRNGRPAQVREHLSTQLINRLNRHYRGAIVRGIRNNRNRRFALHHLFHEYLKDGTLCLVRFEDHEIFIDPRDDKIAFTILSGRAWQRMQFDRALSAACAADRVKTDGVFVDVGANIGAVTLYALLSGRFRHVIALEPDSHNRAILKRNIMHNGFADHVTVIATAASHSAGTLAFYRDAKNLGAHSLEAGFTSKQSNPEHIPVAKLDDIVREAGYGINEISFLKIDVEGHEHAVLDGMGAILASRPPMMLEVTFQKKSGANGSKTLFDDPNATLFRIPVSYTHCISIDEDPVSSVALANFKPSKHQHDLLIL